jgi:hypothetical protein
MAAALIYVEQIKETNFETITVNIVVKAAGKDPESESARIDWVTEE